MTDYTDDCSIEYIIGYDEMHSKIYNMIQTTESNTIYICSFEFDIDYIFKHEKSLKGVMYEYLKNTANTIYLMTSNLNIGRPNDSELCKMGNELSNLKLKLNNNISEIGRGDKHATELDWVKWLFNDPHDTWCDNAKLSACFGLHGRFVYDGIQMLMCAGNYSDKYGHSYNNDNPDANILPYYWWDNALCITLPTDDAEISKTYYDSAVRAWFDDDFSSRSCESIRSPRIISSNKEGYDYIISNIKTASRIHFVNQYFISGGSCGQNRVADEIIKRVIGAMKADADEVGTDNYDTPIVPSFHITMVLNYSSKDETQSRYNLMQDTFYSSSKYVVECIESQLHSLYTNIRDYDNMIFRVNDYIEFKTPIDSRIVIHTKMFVFEHDSVKELLFTSANIIDASFIVGGHQEMGVIVKNDETITKILEMDDSRLVTRAVTFKEIRDFVYNYESMRIMFEMTFGLDNTFNFFTYRLPLHTNDCNWWSELYSE